MTYIKTPEAFRRAGEKTHGKGHAKAKKVGERLSFKVPNGRRSGTVTEVHDEFYLVLSKGRIHKVNRKSILYSLGTFAGRVAQTYGNVKESYEYGKQYEHGKLEEHKVRYAKKRSKKSLWERLKK